MPPPRIEKIITALDVGSWKVCALIAGQTADGQLHVLGTGQRESRGVQRGYVADMEQTEHVVREAIEQAERIAGLNIDDVWVSFSAGSLLSDVAPIESELGGHRIEQEDVDDLLAAGRAGIDPEGRMILHAQPALYTLDGLTGVKNPIGLHADRLGVDIHIIMADGAPVRNLESAVRQAHLDVNAVVASPIAAGLACLSEEERDLGVALVELGAAVTTVSLYAGGMLQSFYGSASASPRDNNEIIELEPGAPSGGDSPRITRAQLVAVIRQRLDAMMGEVGRTLKDLHFVGPIGRQVVLVGGGADLKGIADYTQAALGRAARVGRPRGLHGLPDAHGGPAFATLAGLVLYAASDPVDLRDLPMMAQDVYKPAGTSILHRLMAALKSSF